MPSEPYIGEISMFAGNFAIRGYAFCQGQILSIAQNTALFSILGTTYGGNGQTTFALPDLRGRAPIGSGQGPGLSIRSLGQVLGSETVTLTLNQMPAHNHTVTVNPQAVAAAGTTADPTGAYPANTGALDKEYSTTGSTVNMGAAAGTVGIAGGSQPHDNMPPSLVINFLIALEGIFPSRN